MIFKEHCFAIDVEAALGLAIEAMSEFAAMDQSAKQFQVLEQQVIEKAQQGNSQPRSFALPAVGGIDNHCKTFAQRGHHFGRALLSIARLFLPGASNWDDVKEFAWMGDQKVPFR